MQSSPPASFKQPKTQKLRQLDDEARDKGFPSASRYSEQNTSVMAMKLQFVDAQVASTGDTAKKKKKHHSRVADYFDSPITYRNQTMGESVGVTQSGYPDDIANNAAASMDCATSSPLKIKKNKKHKKKRRKSTNEIEAHAEEIAHPVGSSVSSTPLSQSQHVETDVTARKSVVKTTIPHKTHSKSGTQDESGFSSEVSSSGVPQIYKHHLRSDEEFSSPSKLCIAESPASAKSSIDRGQTTPVSLKHSKKKSRKHRVSGEGSASQICSEDVHVNQKCSEQTSAVGSSADNSLASRSKKHRQLFDAGADSRQMVSSEQPPFTQLAASHSNTQLSGSASKKRHRHDDEHANVSSTVSLASTPSVSRWSTESVIGDSSDRSWTTGDSLNAIERELDLRAGVSRVSLHGSCERRGGGASGGQIAGEHAQKGYHPNEFVSIEEIDDSLNSSYAASYGSIYNDAALTAAVWNVVDSNRPASKSQTLHKLETDRIFELTNLRYRNGEWTQAEDAQLKANVERVLQQHPGMSLVDLFFPQRAADPLLSRQVAAELGLTHFVCQGLFRSVASCFARLERLYHPNRDAGMHKHWKNPVSQSTIVQVHAKAEQYGRNWARIADELGLVRWQVRHIYLKYLPDGSTPSKIWTSDEVRRLTQALEECAGVDHWTKASQCSLQELLVRASLPHTVIQLKDQLRRMRAKSAARYSTTS